MGDNDMESKTRLHPLLSMAAISVMIFSLIGIGAVTGLLPHSSATKAPEPQPPEAAPVEQFSSVTPPLPTVRETAVAIPEPKAVKKQVVRHAPAPQPAPVQIAQAPAAVPPAPVFVPAPVAAAPRPVCTDCGVVEAFREVETKGQGTGLGMVAGGVAGALLGHQFGRGSGKDILTVAGAAGGAFAGNQVEKKVRAGKKFEISVRMEDGSLRTLSQDAAPGWRIGDHVRVVNSQVVSSS
jgi:outer membrane lipoprotein SlyB